MDAKNPWFLVAGTVLATAVLFPREQPAPAQEKEEAGNRHSIATTGTATVTTTPDSARVFFTTRSTGATAAAARDGNNAAMQRLRSALAALKLKSLKTRSTNLTVEPVQVDDGRHAPRTVGFKAVHTSTALVQSEDRELLSMMAQRVSDAGVSTGALVQQVNFFRENEAEVKREALTQATEDGMANAKALARGADVRLLGPVQIDDQPQYEFPVLSNAVQAYSRPGAGGTAVALQAGELKVTCHVHVVCRF